MLRLYYIIRKELLILGRDKGGLAVMFLMPMTLIIIMALIQDAPFKDYQEMKIPMLLVNNDSGTLGKTIHEKLVASKIFEITSSNQNSEIAKQEVKSGIYNVGIIIPSNASKILDKNIKTFVEKKLSEAGLSGDTIKEDIKPEDLNIELFFSSDTKKSFKTSILASLKHAASQIETQSLIHAFSTEIESSTEDSIKSFVNFYEEAPKDIAQEALKLNSVQHNVPAWTVFGMFFIVISMAGSIIKERDDGSFLRIKTMPGSFINVLFGKIWAYLLITFIQAILMLLVGLYILPLLDLPQLVIGNNYFALFSIIFCTGLAATGYGVLVGSIFKTHQQSSTFGAVSIVILAALGGIWVPVYVMPESLQTLAEISPLYWSLNAFNNIFLNNASFADIAPWIIKLILFFTLMLLLAFLFGKNTDKK